MLDHSHVTKLPYPHQDTTDDHMDLVNNHMKAVKRIRSVANSNSRTTAKRMVVSARSANPPAKYAVGSEVLVRRFSERSKKRHGKGLARKMSRVVKGTITDVKQSSHQYKVQYKLNGKLEQTWHSVSDITSLTRQEERSRPSKYTNQFCVNKISDFSNTLGVKFVTKKSKQKEGTKVHDSDSDCNSDTSTVDHGSRPPDVVLSMFCG